MYANATQKGCLLLLLFWPVKKYAWPVDFFICSPRGRWAKNFISDPHSTHEHGTAAKDTRARAWHSGPKHTSTSMAQRPKTHAHEHGTAAKNTWAWHSGPTHTTQLLNKEKGAW